MKILTKFVRSSVALAGLILSVTLVSEMWLSHVRSAKEEAHHRADLASHLALDLKLLLREQIAALKNYLILDREPSDIAKYHQSMSEFLLTLDEVETVMPESVELVSFVRTRHSFLERLATEMRDTPTTLNRTQQDFRSINSFRNDIDFYLDELVTTLERQLVINIQEEQQFVKTAQAVRYATSGIILLGFCGQLLFIVLPVIRSIHKLQLGAAKIGAGNLDYRLHIPTQDEIENVALEFNQMAEKLSHLYLSLEQKVRDRTAELTESNQQLGSEILERKQAEAELQQALQDLQQTQTQLIQTEKMSSLGQLVAGVAHEINNPVNFIYGNLTYISEYSQELIELVELYQNLYPESSEEIQGFSDRIELEYVKEDMPKMISSMKVGADRIREIVLSLRNFSRLDESDMKEVDIHQGIESTLLILQNRFKAKSDRPRIELIKEYGGLPLVECYAGQLNQVFMNVLSNAIDALESATSEENGIRCKENTPDASPTIRIRTEAVEPTLIIVRIADNGSGMSEEVRKRLFDPFFTTKPVGKGTGLGLSISYTIVEKHGGTLSCESKQGEGTQFTIAIPVSQNHPKQTNLIISDRELQPKKALTALG